jgi:hypothetical protein
MQEFLIEKIRTDGGVQSRERISDDYVMELAELIKAGKKLPPVDVYSDGAEIWAADGFHRIYAHLKANKRTVRCNVHKGSIKDAIWASVAANQEHGLRRTNADKRHAVEMALKSRPDLSARAVADHVGVEETMVRNLKVRCGFPAPDAVVGRDGKTYRIPPPPCGERTERIQRQEVTPRKIPPPPCGKPVSSGQGAVNEEENSNPHPSPSTALRAGPLPSQGEGEERGGKIQPPLAPVPSEAGRLDEVGKPIPDHLWPLWDRGAEIAQMASTVTRMAGLIRRMHNEGDLVILDGNGQAIVAALETAKQGLNANIPFAVCPYCKGTLSDGCRFCKGRGIVGDFAYKHVPGELKS